MTVRPRSLIQRTAMYSIRLRRAAHVRDYSIRSIETLGWEVMYLENRTLRRLDLYDDWHRVERALVLFRREVAELTTDGWEVQPAGFSHR